MENLLQAIQSLSNLELFLLGVILLGAVYIYFKLVFIEMLNKQLVEARVSNHNLYMMYMQLSNSSLEYVNKWMQTAQERDELFKTIHSSPKSDS